ncbi:hypothetical protein [Curtobacterium sp. RRHDQ10]|uniref:hypothetical protein n=1 Tax=Curtobacterium phyllosphaerae TaxID=3413379 RepID=UPI003BEFE027
MPDARPDPAVPPSSDADRAVEADVRVVAPSLRTTAIALWVVAVALIPLAAGTQGVAALPFAVVPSVFVAVFAWLVLWRPHVTATADALVIADVRRTTSIPWRRVVEIRSRHGLEVVTSEGVRRTWIAPRGSARLRLVGDGDGDPDPTVPSGRPGGAHPVTVHAAAARLAARIPAARPIEGPPPAHVERIPITVRTHWVAVLVLVVLGVLASLSGARI